MHIPLMSIAPTDFPPDQGIDSFLAEVKGAMINALLDTPLGELVDNFGNILGTGKMLRSRLAYRIGPATRTPREELIDACAAVEMVHAASLLHDDVIDGGMMRRGLPTFWIERGVSGAILLGDMLLFKALDITCSVHEDCRWTRKLVRMTGQVCQAESEQELLLRGRRPTWEQSVRIARYKTGALFAFSAYAAAGTDPGLQLALEEAGYLVGTCYQLADDILDTTGSEKESGKTLGTDETRDKITAASAAALCDVDPVERIQSYCATAEKRLLEWPEVTAAWRGYMEKDLAPTLESNLDRFSRLQAAAG
jgi:geranylgeranyl pyrophosphate synthase